jgi:hypothetical protein
MRNRAALVPGNRTGCFYCCAVFDASEISEWVDDRQVETGSLDDGSTALCPRCGIDAVLPGSAGTVITPALLAEMKAHWF